MHNRHSISLGNYMGCLVEFYESFINVLDEKVFQNPLILCRTHGLFPEQTTLDGQNPFQICGLLCQTRNTPTLTGLSS
jgi:hypothetical protein